MKNKKTIYIAVNFEGNVIGVAKTPKGLDDKLAKDHEYEVASLKLSPVIAKAMLQEYLKRQQFIQPILG